MSVTRPRRWFGGVLAVAVAGLSVIGPPIPANAGAGDFISYLQYVKQAYNIYNDYLSGRPGTVEQIQAAINVAQSNIIAEVDAVATGDVAGCTRDTINTMLNLSQYGHDALQVQAGRAVSCLDLAAADIGALGDRAAVDRVGFALNAVGPMAVMINRLAGLSTGDLQQTLIDGNKSLLTRLAPACFVTYTGPIGAYPGGGPIPVVDDGPAPGHGQCYRYNAVQPHHYTANIYFANSGPGIGALPWTVTGQKVSEVLWVGKNDINWPLVTDYTIAIDQAMAGTSYPVAILAMNKLDNPVAPLASPVAMAFSDQAGQIKAFGVTTNGQLLHSTFILGQAATWSAVADAPELRSVAAAANTDGRVEVFGLNRTGRIYHRWQQAPGDDNSWSAWSQMDGQLNSIAVARNANGTLQVFGTNSFGNIWTRNQILGGDVHVNVQTNPRRPAINAWSPWKQFDGALAQVSAATDAGGKIELYGVTSSGTMFHRQENTPDATDPSVPGSWSGWDQIAGIADTIAVANGTGGEFQIFACLGNTAYQLTKTASGQYSNGFVPLLGTIRNVSAVTAGNVLLLLGVDPSTGIAYTNVNNGGYVGGWLGWGPVSGSTLRYLLF